MRTLKITPSATLILAAALSLTACASRGSSTFGGGATGGLSMPNGTDGGGTTTGGTTAGTDGGTDSGVDSGTDGGGTDTGTTFTGTGYDITDVAYDLTGTAQDGSDWSLYAHAGTPVVLIVGHMDDPGFVSMMGWLGSTAGATVAAVVGRDENSIQSTVTEAVDWAGTYGIPTVIADTTGELINTWAERNPPKTYVIDANMTIVWTQFGTVSQIQVNDQISAL